MPRAKKKEADLPQIKVGEFRKVKQTVVDVDYDEAAKKMFIDHAIRLILGEEKPHSITEMDDRLIEIAFVDILAKSCDEQDKQWALKTGRKPKARKAKKVGTKVKNSRG